MLFFVIPLLLHSLQCLAKTNTYNWDVGWVTACPDGFCRPVIGINGVWPLPILEADLGDTLVVTVNNKLGNETTSIHFHGILQHGTPEMDGVAQVSQCPIPADGSFTHTSVASPGGTRWYHSHDKGQYPDGLRAPMIIHDRVWENSLNFSKEYVFSVSDWYHEQMPYLLHDYLDGSDFGGNTFKGQIPLPASTLINDTQSINLDMESDKTYLIRMVSVSAMFPHTISFEDHEMTIVAVDGVATKPRTTNAITIAAGQRYDVLITGLTNPKQEYTITSTMEGTSHSASGTIRYGSSTTSSYRKKRQADVAFLPTDDITLEAADGEPLYSPVDQSLTFPVKIQGKANRRLTLGNASYVSPKVPSLYTALTTGADAWNSIVYGPSVNPVITKTGQVVQIIVENQDDVEHPMHLHGYVFQVVARGPGTWDGNEASLPQIPVKRDVTTTPPSGHLVLRIKTNNPGVWVFHCHMEFHVEAGMMATFVESPDILQQTIKISQSALDICAAQGIPTGGNCAGETTNVLDTSDCNNNPPDEDWGALINPPSASKSKKTRRSSRVVRRGGAGGKLPLEWQ